MRLAALVMAARIASRTAGILVALTLAGGFIGCGGGDPAHATCPMDLPMSCPSPPPSWKTDVQPLINKLCVPCHSPTGVESVLNYTTYQGVKAEYAEMNTQLYNCIMPLATAPQPTEAERQTLLKWFACMAPDN